MGRRALAIFLLILGISIIVMLPIVAFTPVGTLVFGAQDAPDVPPTPTPLPIKPTPRPTPVLTVTGTPPAVTAKAAYLLDNDTGHTLDDVHGETPLPMASTTKIMTAIIAIQAGNLDQTVTITQAEVNEALINDGSNAQLQVGDKISRKDLLYALLLPSGDDAAMALADSISGSPAAFVNVMNITAYRLHLFQTHFMNPDGLTYYADAAHTKLAPDPYNYTSAYDLVRLAHYAMQLPLFAQIVKTPQYVLPATGSHHSYSWTTTNALISSHTEDSPQVKVDPDVSGIKTGFTVEAGPCLVFSATHAGHDLIGVVLSSTSKADRFHDAVTLLTWGFGLPLRLPQA